MMTRAQPHRHLPTRARLLTWLATLLATLALLSACQDDLDRGLVDRHEPTPRCDGCGLTDMEARIFEAWREELLARHALSPQAFGERVLLDSIDLNGRQTWTVRFVLLPAPTLREHVVEVGHIRWEDPRSDLNLADAVRAASRVERVAPARTGR